MALHVRTLRAALGWAFAQRLIACQPMDGMRGLPQPEPRRDVPVAVVAGSERHERNNTERSTLAH